MSSNLKQQTIAGFGWTAVTQTARFLNQFILTLVLARLLTPTDFGLFGMIVLWTDFLVFFGELGLGAALIQREALEEGHITAVFWLSGGMGLLLTLAVLALAPALAWFYGEPRLQLLAMLLAGQLGLTALQTVPMALLNRAMDFRRLAIAELCGIGAGGSVALVLTLKGAGVLSLAGQVVTTALVTAVALWANVPWRPHGGWRKSHLHDLWPYSGNLLGFTAISYWSRNADNLLVGKFLGATALGFYDRAYSVMLLPLSQVAQMLGRVMFPALTRIQEDKRRVKQVYLQGVSLVALITFPMMLGLMVLTDHFVLALYGSQWTAVIPLLRILSFVGLLQSITTTTGWIYQSQGRTDWLFRWGLAQNGLFLVGFVTAVRQGSLAAVVVVYALFNLLLFYGHLTLPGRLIHLTVWEVVKELAGIFACAVVMAVAVALVRPFVPTHWPHLVHLLVLSAFGGLVYWVLLHVSRVAAYGNGRQLLRDRLFMSR